MLKKSFIVTIFLISIILFEINFLMLFSEQTVANIRDGIIICFMILSCAFFVSNKIKDKFLKSHLLLYLIYYLFIILESIFKYNSIIKYPHILLTISSFFYTVVFYTLLRINTDLFLNRLCYVTCGYIYIQEIIMRVYNPYSYRVLPVHIIYMLLFVTLYFTINQVTKSALYKSIIIIINLLFIVVENHRTVWVSGFTGGILLTIFLGKIKKIHIKKKYLSISIFCIILFLFAFSFTNQEFKTYFKERIEDIYKFKEQGTGK